MDNKLTALGLLCLLCACVVYVFTVPIFQQGITCPQVAEREGYPMAVVREKADDPAYCEIYLGPDAYGNDIWAAVRK